MDKNKNIQLVRTAEKVVVKDPAQVVLNSLAAIEMVNIRRILAQVRRGRTSFGFRIGGNGGKFSKKASINLDTIRFAALFVHGKIPNPTQPGKFVLIRKGSHEQV